MGLKVFLLLLVLGAMALWPFVMLRRPWAVRLWERFKLVILVYVLVIALAAAIALIFRWDEFYG